MQFPELSPHLELETFAWETLVMAFRHGEAQFVGDD
jgi:hypothetical protein